MATETIHQRTVFFEVDKKGYYRPFDWARVTTNVGTMLEPRPEIMPRTANGVNIADFDPEDEMSMITGIENIDLDKQQLMLGEHIHGGYIMPRDGR